MSLVLKQRGLTTQSAGVQNTGAPGDLLAVDDPNGGTPSFTRRPVGPSLSGPGWSGHNTNAGARHTFAIAAASGPDLVGMFGAWYYFGPGMATLSGEVELLNVTNQLGGNEYEGLRMHVGTMSLDLFSLNARFPDANNIKTVRRNWWVWLGLAWEFSGGTWIMKVLYREAGSNTTQTLYTTATYTTGGGPNLMTGARGGAIAPPGSTAVIAFRYGLPSLYQMASMADAAYPAEIIEPTTGPNSWYVSSSAAGGGTGISPAQAWTPAELVTNVGNNFAVLSGEVVDSVGAVWDTDSMTADALVAVYYYGIAFFNGDKIYLDDSSGPIRAGASIDLKLCDGVSVLPLPALGRKVDVRGTTRVSSWTLISGTSWKATVGGNVVWEFPDAATANSIAGKATWLAHPAGITTAAGFAAVATDGSFGTNGNSNFGTEVYVRATGSGNPNSNGKVYETSTAVEVFSVNCRGALMKNLAIRYTAMVDVDNSNTNSTGYAVRLQGDGLCVIDGCDTIGTGRHGLPILEGVRSTKLRAAILNCTLADGVPTAYCGVGGQTMLVVFGSTDARDNQAYFENVTVTTNVGVIGSNAGALDPQQATIIEHNANVFPNVIKPFSKSWMRRCALPGSVQFAYTTTNSVMEFNTLGSAQSGSGVSIGGPAGTVTFTQNRATGPGLPSIGQGLAGVTLATVRSNILVATGAIGAISQWVGNVNFDGNTIDATTATGGTTKALATRGGTLVANVRGNLFLFNNADAYRFLDTVTPASGDALNMAYNQLQGSTGGNPDTNRILVSNYGGAVTKTLAQLQAGGQDTGSVWSVDVKADPATYRIAGDSPARDFVPLASVPSLASVPDFNGRTRPPSGKTDAGALQFVNAASGLARFRNAGARGVRIGRKF